MKELPEGWVCDWRLKDCRLDDCQNIGNNLKSKINNLKLPVPVPSKMVRRGEE